MIFKLFALPVMMAPLLAGCGAGSSSTKSIRPKDAVLTLAQVKQGQASGMKVADLTSLSSNQNCAGVVDLLKQISESTQGALKFEGNGVLTVPRQVWAQAPGDLKSSLVRAAAMDAACTKETVPQDTVVTVRDPGGAIIQQGPLRGLAS